MLGTMTSAENEKNLQKVKGVGASAERKLKAAGVATVGELSTVDLRSLDVEGLSSDHVAKLRGNAERYIQAQEVDDLTLVDGLGPSARDKLHAAGIETLEDLAYVDLRSKDVEGLSTENLQKLKRNARYLLP